MALIRKLTVQHQTWLQFLAVLLNLYQTQMRGIENCPIVQYQSFVSVKKILHRSVAMKFEYFPFVLFQKMANQNENLHFV